MVAPPLGAGLVRLMTKSTLAPGATRMFEGSTIRATSSVVTVTAVTVPLNPPDAVPPMLEDPGVVVERTVPAADELSLAPAGIVVVEVVSTQRAVLLEVREITMAWAARTGAPTPSTARPVMLLVETPSAPIVDRLALRITCAIRVSKIAPTLFAAFIVTEHPADPVHVPLQPTKVDAESGNAASATLVPSAKSAVQAVPQSMPPGVLLTVPPPEPAFVTVRTYLT